MNIWCIKGKAYEGSSWKYKKGQWLGELTLEDTHFATANNVRGRCVIKILKKITYLELRLNLSLKSLRFLFKTANDESL